MQKVTRHDLVPNGSTFTSKDTDFLVADSLDFHPTDVIEDADGSLLVVDTGAWYKLCCPTSQLAKPDVPGAIYRVRKRGAPVVADARGRRLDWQEASAAALMGRLADRRPAVWRRTIEALVRLGPDRALPALTGAIAGDPSVDVRQRALWTAMRLPLTAAGAAVRPACAIAILASSAWRCMGPASGAIARPFRRWAICWRRRTRMFVAWLPRRSAGSEMRAPFRRCSRRRRGRSIASASTQ